MAAVVTSTLTPIASGLARRTDAAAIAARLRLALGVAAIGLALAAADAAVAAGEATAIAVDLVLLAGGGWLLIRAYRQGRSGPVAP